MKRILTVSVIVLVCVGVIAGIVITSTGGVIGRGHAGGYDYTDSVGGAGGGDGYSGYSGGSPPVRYSTELDENLGYSVGGAKDVNNFRENIENGFLPLFTDITYEGLFYDYYFDTGQRTTCTHLFCPSYSYAVSRDPFSRMNEYYLSVGLNSNIKESDFHRKKLNLVIVLDISASMSSSFDRYYYDSPSSSLPYQENEWDYRRSKIDLATESVVALLDHLNSDDRFGMVLFNDYDQLLTPLKPVGFKNMGALKQTILGLEARGGTQLSAGMRAGTDLFGELMYADPSEYENRIVFITDAMPNIGDTSEWGLLGTLERNSEHGIYTTFIGIGVDFNTELVDYITKIKGANYYSVHTPGELRWRMESEFEFMVTPLVFDLTLTLDAEGYEIVKVYGSPEANEATGELMRVNTLFPSKIEGGEIRGGLILLELRRVSPETNLRLRVSYEDRVGHIYTDEAFIQMPEGHEYYQNSGIRKGILLSRYADLMKNWINDERESYFEAKSLEPSIDWRTGIIVPEVPLGRWERQSIPLRVSTHYQHLFSHFSTYFENEMNSIGDSDLDQELTILDKLSNY